jgi:tetratricopeptide (TPR) repeat protein
MTSNPPSAETEVSAAGYINRALDRHDHYDYPRAIRLFTAALQLDPTNADAAFHRGHAYRYDGNLQAAIEDYSEAIRLDPAFAAAYYHRAELRKELLDVEGAIADYETYLDVCDGLCDEDRREIQQVIRDLRAQREGRP